MELRPLPVLSLISVSYTHLDVYKSQGLNRGIVITRRRHAITHEHHFIGPYAKCLRQLAHGIGLIDAAFADIHTGVSAGPDPHMRQIGLDRFDQRLFLRVIAIPCLLGRYGRELPKSGEGDLAAPVLDSRPPYLLFRCV